MSTNNLVLKSLKLLSEQLTDGLKQVAGFKLPKNYRKISNVVVSGMGGSNLAGRIMASVFSQELKLPLVINADYEIPRFVNRDTLFIAVSYSGATEETLHAYSEAKKQGAKIVAITSTVSQNRLAALVKKDGYPCLCFSATANPSGQPRLGLGYSLIFLLKILEQVGALKISSTALSRALAKLNSWNERLLPEKSNNLAAQIAAKLHGMEILIVSGEFLAGSAHTLRNQLNETGKNFAAYLTLPEMNHYALEGLAKPNLKDSLVALFWESNLYSPRVAKRLELTKKVAAKNHLTCLSIKLKGANKLEQALEMLSLGSWISYYLALDNKVNPLTVPWVEWFKKELK